MRRICKGLALAGLGAALIVPGTASAASLGQLYHSYSNTGAIDPCTHSSAELQSALDSVPTDVQQYDPRFAEALKNALNYRASGGCNKRVDQGVASNSSAGGFGGTGGGGGGTTARDGSPKPPGAPAGTPKGALSANPAAASFDADRGFPLPLGILAAVVAAILASAGFVAYGRRHGWELPGPPSNPFGVKRARLVD
jgi:hypothetical protein